MQPLEKVVALAAIEPAAQRIRRGAIGARRASKPKIDPVGKQRFSILKPPRPLRTALISRATPTRWVTVRYWLRASQSCIGREPAPDIMIGQIRRGDEPYPVGSAA